MSDTMTVEVTTETTRNEHSVIFKVNKVLLGPGTGQSFPDAQSAKNYPLANALFQIKGVSSVWVIGSEVQVTKEDRARWGSLTSRIVETLKDQLA